MLMGSYSFPRMTLASLKGLAFVFSGWSRATGAVAGVFQGCSDG